MNMINMMIIMNMNHGNMMNTMSIDTMNRNMMNKREASASFLCQSSFE